jgi:broad specificity phosphatase PhoE
VGEVIAVVVGVVSVSVVVAVVDVDVTSVDVMPVVSKSDAFIVPPAAAYPVTPRSAVAAVVARTRSGLTNVTFSGSGAWQSWQAPPMPQQIVLVRHGETEWSRDLKHTGRTDVPLTEVGEAQARAVGEALRGRQFALVLSSPLRRALDTARLAGFEPELREELAEWDYGDFEGITTVEIRQEIPDWTIWRYGARGGEGVAEVEVRVDRVVEELRRADDDVLVFGHGHVLRVLAARWVGLAVADGRLFALDSATLSALGYERDEPVIRVWNAPLA